MITVRFNGSKESDKHYSDPNILVVGEKYEATHSVTRDLFDTYYILKGIKGKFNSEWFSIVPDYDGDFHLTIATEVPMNDRHDHLAIANEYPMIDREYSCFMLESINGELKLVKCTDNVKEIVIIGQDIYKVTGLNGVYIVKVY